MQSIRAGTSTDMKGQLTYGRGMDRGAGTTKG
jgi:hypothetical protein